MDLEINIKTEWMHCIDEHDMFKLPQTTSPWAKKSSSKNVFVLHNFTFGKLLLPLHEPYPKSAAANRQPYA